MAVASSGSDTLTGIRKPLCWTPLEGDGVVGRLGRADEVSHQQRKVQT